VLNLRRRIVVSNVVAKAHFKETFIIKFTEKHCGFILSKLAFPMSQKQHQNQDQNHVKINTIKTKIIPRPKLQNQNFKISIGFDAYLALVSFSMLE
jgi:hypothetical protein